MKNKTYAEILAFILKNESPMTISYRDIAKEIGCSYSTVHRAINYLDSIKIIKLLNEDNMVSVITYDKDRFKSFQNIKEIYDDLNDIFNVLYSFMNNT